ncbi:MAG: hypothetical protein RQ966_00615 [Acetobacteraceae bacterium]|nr:hypothetical protein [Acetobacteraceae bacterium]
MRRTATAMLVLGSLPLLASCAGSGTYTQGPLQPQSLSGPCSVDRFFFLGNRSVPARLTIANTGQTCTFTLVNPALNAVINATLLTKPAQHGRAETSLISGARQVSVSYTPAPGYTGPDQFGVTLEPGATGITFNVTVTPPR